MNLEQPAWSEASAPARARYARRRDRRQREEEEEAGEAELTPPSRRERVLQQGCPSVCDTVFCNETIYEDFESCEIAGWVPYSGMTGFGNLVGGEVLDGPDGSGLGQCSMSAKFEGNNPESEGFFGGFQKINPPPFLDLSEMTSLDFWIKPESVGSFTIEINLQELPPGGGRASVYMQY